jgi:uncharacterized membrane protein YbhN (UPF0104 family)
MPLLKIAVTIGTLWFVLASTSLSLVARSIAHADLLWLAVAAVVALLQLLAAGWRWQLVHRLLTGANLAFGSMLRGSSRGLLFGQALPSSVGTDIVRAIALARDAGLGAAVRSVLCDRLLGLFALLVIVSATLPPFAHTVDGGAAFGSLAFVALGGLGLMLLMIIFSSRLARLPAVGPIAAWVAADLRQAICSPAGMGPMALAFLSHVLSVILFVAAAYSTGAAISLRLALLIVPPTMLVSSLPISLGGWGVRETLIASAYNLIGRLPAAGVAASIIFGLSGPVAGACVELAWIVFWRRLEKRGRAASGAT